ncbi:histidine kinase [Streptomyces sp. XM83C]|uniref:histidine kinase n=1 Tax=Streptomyces thermocoprophilus TaxID=78356 RepID=A0ABV5VBJ7_9ACTN|nr:histidine kinase [Streptomyces sp. XM83C]MCK1819597.1 histidine kinase [Streptomyces sp. XM83C]
MRIRVPDTATNDPVHRLTAFDRRHPLVRDLGLTVLVAAVSLLAGPPSGLPGRAALAVVLAAVALRRRHPFAALLVTTAATAATTAGALLLPGAPPWTYLAVWVTLFGAVLRDSRPRVTRAAAGAVVVLAAAALAAPPGEAGTTPRERLLLVVAVTATAGAAALTALLVRGNRSRVAAEQAEIARTAAVTERTRIAREIHDVIGHNLSVITALAAGGSVAAPGSPDDAVRAFDAIGEVSRTSAREVRRVLKVLREDAGADGAPLSPQPRIDDLPALLDAVRDAGLDVVLRRSGDLDTLGAGRQLAVYRVVQESLTNVLRHAGPAARARVAVERGPDAVTVTVTDTGAAPPPAAARPGGHGLPGMRERVEAYGGTFEAGPAGTGWRVRARIPADDPDTLPPKPARHTETENRRTTTP